VQAGNGGNGCESFTPRTDKKIVSNGGDGGNGGNIIFRSAIQAPGLGSFRLKQHLIGDHGGHGGSSRKRGKNGEDLIIEVPVGTRIYDRQRQFLIRHLLQVGDEVIVSKGGHGGAGNHRGKQAERGEQGTKLELELNLLIAADIFLLGIPNAGKSKLLNLLTGSHAKEGDYAFTTRSPEMGVWSPPAMDEEKIRLCELPSLYDASHDGRGLGTDFLKHLEGAPMILFMLDPLSKFSESLSDGFSILKKELEKYDKNFGKIPVVVAVNKMDLPEAKEKVKKQKFRPKAPVFFISALTGEGMDKLESYLKEAVYSRAEKK